MAGPTFLEGPTVELRTIEEEDLDFIQRNLNDPAIRWNTELTTPMNGVKRRQYFEEKLSGSEVHLLVCDDETRVGYVNMTQLDYKTGTGDLGVWIATEHQGNGYGTEALATLVTYAFEEHRLRRLVARCFESNERTQSMLEAIGFTLEGQLRDAYYNCGDYVDELVYGLLRSEWDENHAEQ